MRPVEFVDSSILIELLEIPGMASDPEGTKDALRDRASAGISLILPLASIVETGNHVSHVAEGSARRRCAEGFVALLRATIKGDAPWVLHARAWDLKMLGLLCDGVRQTGNFVEVALAQIIGLGDLSILAEAELYAGRVDMVSVSVWTKDSGLAAYASA